jgi:putative transposase
MFSESMQTNVLWREEIFMDGYNRGSHSVYQLTYHIVFVTKYRKRVITDEMGDFMKNHAEYLCGRMNCKLLSAETDGDHMHLLVSMPPDVAPVRLINSLKSNLSKEVHIYYRELIEKYLLGDSPFWSASYFCATTGSVSMETVKKYIEDQRTEEHKRKYTKSGKYKKQKS